jgi:hypothetical protein
MLLTDLKTDAPSLAPPLQSSSMQAQIDVFLDKIRVILDRSHHAIVPISRSLTDMMCLVLDIIEHMERSSFSFTSSSSRVIPNIILMLIPSFSPHGVSSRQLTCCSSADRLEFNPDLLQGPQWFTDFSDFHTRLSAVSRSSSSSSSLSSPVVRILRDVSELTALLPRENAPATLFFVHESNHPLYP